MAGIRQEAPVVTIREGGNSGGGGGCEGGCVYILKKNQIVFTNIMETGCENERRQG